MNKIITITGIIIIGAMCLIGGDLPPAERVFLFVVGCVGCWAAYYAGKFIEVKK